VLTVLGGIGAFCPNSYLRISSQPSISRRLATPWFSPSLVVLIHLVSALICGCHPSYRCHRPWWNSPHNAVNLFADVAPSINLSEAAGYAMVVHRPWWFV